MVGIFLSECQLGQTLPVSSRLRNPIVPYPAPKTRNRSWMVASRAPFRGLKLA